MSTPSHLQVTSADGTVIGAEVVGAGPSLVLVHGSTADRTRWLPLVPLLREEFTLVMVDRRGRGLSAEGEPPQYELRDESADLLAVLAAIPGPALVFGHSYGATVSLSVLSELRAAAVLLYEPPFATPGHPVFDDAQLDRWQALLDAGDREALLEAFYREALAFDEASIDALRPLPIWQARLAAVHTVVREAREVTRYRPQHMATDVPVRFLLGEATTPHLVASTTAAAESVAGSALAVLPGQGHVAIDAAPDLIAQHVRETWSLRRR